MKTKILLNLIFTLCVIALVTEIGNAQVDSSDGTYTFMGSPQKLSGNGSAYLNFYGGHNDITTMAFYDKQGTRYGQIYGSANGKYFGLVDGDGNTFLRSRKDDYIEFRIDNSEKMRILSNGGVAIGATSVPLGYKLAVDGKGIFEEVRVKPSTAWPDYVFKSSYHLMSIEEKEAFTKENHHLPSVQPEAMITSKGMDVGKTYADLLKEVEEAHLYIFQLNDTVKELQKQMEELKQQSGK